MNRMSFKQISFREAREKKRMSLKEVADKIGVSVYELKEYEVSAGKTPCSVVVKLCRLYMIKSAEQIVDPSPQHAHIKYHIETN